MVQEALVLPFGTSHQLIHGSLTTLGAGVYKNLGRRVLSPHFGRWKWFANHADVSTKSFG